MPITGHSFHIGGMLHLLLLGVNPFIVMVQGHWSSNSFLAYSPKSKEIIPLFISFSLDSHPSILMTISCFKSHLLNKIDFTQGSQSTAACQLATTCHLLVIVESPSGSHM